MASGDVSRPDILGLALSIPPHKIKTRCRDGLKATYEVKAFDTLGHLRFHRAPLSSLFKVSLPAASTRTRLRPSFHRRDPVETQGRVVLDERIPTDRERFWHIFQTRWLPLLEASMAERLKKESPDGQNAFWEDISIQVSMEETDMRLPLGEERICPLEALHEDLYFVLLQFFSSFARRYGAGGSLHLGRIVPIMRNLAANSSPRASLKPSH
jgi:hypothetical protein